jgi:PadR family transcriptional regulator, regulatory protein PadR
MASGPPDNAALPLPRNFLRPCVLLLLRESPAHGYDLLERLKAFGFPGSDPGGLYRMLRGLEQEGLVRSAWEPSMAGPKRRIYEITRAGSESLHEHAQVLRGTAEILEGFVSRYAEFVALPSRKVRARTPR